MQIPQDEDPSIIHLTEIQTEHVQVAIINMSQTRWLSINSGSTMRSVRQTSTGFRVTVNCSLTFQTIFNYQWPFSKVEMISLSIVIYLSQLFISQPTYICPIPSLTVILPYEVNVLCML